MTDCCVIVLGIHLSRHHVIPILLLRLGIGSWSNYHGGRRHVCAIHVLNRMVSRISAQTAWSAISTYTPSREFCLRHPEIRDVCDVGQMLYFGWTWVWYLTAAMFLLNNTFIQVSLGQILSLIIC